MRLNELYSKEEALEVITALRDMFRSEGFEIAYDGHALSRLLGRDASITKEEMLDTFSTLFATRKKVFRQMNNKKAASMIVRDAHNKGNYVINFSNNKGLIMTAMKKAGFQADHDRQGSVIVDLQKRGNVGGKKKNKKGKNSPTPPPTGTPPQA